jgi:ABC-type transport system involved in cytochrome bd biosynthesis fused ATPase/permease subunit
LSGSAEDMLGLALRVTLTKTFLPGIDMLQLDEPAAACSDAREARLLGLLAKLGFGQTILITHSDQADAFADRIINV